MYFLIISQPKHGVPGLQIRGHTVILLPAHPASFAHKFLLSESGRVPGCKGIADLSLKIVFWTRKFAVGTH